MFVCAYIPTHEYLHTRHTDMYTHIGFNECVRVRAHTHAHARTHMHTHTHIVCVTHTHSLSHARMLLTLSPPLAFSPLAF